MIKVLKLVTGDDVIAEMLEDSSGKKVSLKNPQRFIMTQEGLGSIPLMPLSGDDQFIIGMDHVVLICEPEVDVKNSYNAQHGSGIVLASSSSKILKS
jgi:hypothetical protein